MISYFVFHRSRQGRSSVLQTKNSWINGLQLRLRLKNNSWPSSKILSHIIIAITLTCPKLWLHNWRRIREQKNTKILRKPSSLSQATYELKNTPNLMAGGRMTSLTMRRVSTVSSHLKRRKIKAIVLTQSLNLDHPMGETLGFTKTPTEESNRITQ